MPVLLLAPHLLPHLHQLAVQQGQATAAAAAQVQVQLAQPALQLALTAAQQKHSHQPSHHLQQAALAALAAAQLCRLSHSRQLAPLQVLLHPLQVVLAAPPHPQMSHPQQAAVPAAAVLLRQISNRHPPQSRRKM